MEGKVDALHILDQRPALDHKLTWKVSVAMMVTGVLLEDICGSDGHKGLVGYWWPQGWLHHCIDRWHLYDTFVSI